MNRLPPDDPLRAIVEEISAAGGHAAALTQQLLAFSRGQSPMRELLQINDVIKDLERMLNPLLGASIALTVTLDDRLGVVELDRGQLEQVIVNLVVNARDAMPQGGALTITTANVDVDDAVAAQIAVDAGAYVRLSVADAGVGMSTDVIAQMYDPFFTTKEHGGTGLGLSTVYGIMKQNGGGIAVATERGRGATFELYFPRVDRAAKSPPSHLSDVAPHGTETLLVVEDQDALRRVLSELLRGFGYAIIETGDPREAARIATEEDRRIDLLLTDVVMPGMSGPELALRVVSARPRVKVLYMSGFADRSLPDDPGGNVLVLKKPFTGEVLAQRIRQVLDEPE